MCDNTSFQKKIMEPKDTEEWLSLNKENSTNFEWILCWSNENV
jgi:hypothetical protein